MELANTWADTWSSEAARRRSSSGSVWPSVTTSAKAGLPCVRVPVLSNSITRPEARRSRAPPPLITTPMCAALDSPDMIAIGAARSSGQGVATTSTATARTGSAVHHHDAPASEERQRDEGDGDPVRHPHKWGRRRLGLRDEADDARIRRLRRRRRSDQLHGASRIDHTRADNVAWYALDRQRLARQRRLIEHGRGQQATIDGNDLTGADQQPIPRYHHRPPTPRLPPHRCAASPCAGPARPTGSARVEPAPRPGLPAVAR